MTMILFVVSFIRKVKSGKREKNPWKLWINYPPILN